jgi:serine/threonine protein kinase/Tfp pilus assembly protein PilF
MARWDAGDQVDAQAVLHAHPELAEHKELVIELAYEEYCQRAASGETIDPDTFCSRFTDCRASLRKLIEVHSYYKAHPELAIPDSTWPEPDTMLLDFHVLGELGRGAFARVYLAEEVPLGRRPVAIKVSMTGAEEAAMLGKLRHANIVPIYSVQHDPESLASIICMPYLGRTTLAHVVERLYDKTERPARAQEILDCIGASKWSPDYATPAANDRVLQTARFADGVAHLGAQLAEALAYTHDQGICHRDLKPSNVLLAAGGKPMLLDFNLSSDEQMVARRIGGTLPYMPPELVKAALNNNLRDAVLDARSDIFSLGVMLYELLTGQLPFGPPENTVSDRDAWQRILERQQNGARLPADGAADSNDSLWRTIARCLEYDPSDRFQSAHELVRLLQRDLTRLSAARRWLGRHRKSLVAATAVAMVSSLATAYAIQNRTSITELQIGLAAYERQEFAAALPHLTAAIDAEPRLVEALIARGRTYHRMRNLQDALSDYQAAHKLQPSAELAALIGYCEASLKRFAGAAAHLQEAIDRGLKTAALLNNLGYCQFEMQSFSEAEQMLAAAIAADPELPAPYFNRAATTVRRLGREPRAAPLSAIADVEAALERGCDCGELRYFGMVLCGVAARWDEKWIGSALTHARRAIEQGMPPVELDVNPYLGPVRSDPRFEAVRRIGIGPRESYRATRLVDPLRT